VKPEKVSLFIGLKTMICKKKVYITLIFAPKFDKISRTKIER
jgi:hypothetical protein